MARDTDKNQHDTQYKIIKRRIDEGFDIDQAEQVERKSYITGRDSSLPLPSPPDDDSSSET